MKKNRSLSSLNCSIYTFLLYILKLKYILGAFGYFEVTHDITKYCKADLFSSIGKQTPVALRFSTVGGESGSADTVRYGLFESYYL